MTASERANLPRWRGQAGFVEVWFLVLFEPRTASAAWLRYSLYAPAPGVAGAPRATVWGAWFEAGRTSPTVAAKALHPLDGATGFAHDRFDVRLGASVLTHGRASGTVGRLAWDISFVPFSDGSEDESGILGILPLPSRVVRPNPDVTFTGTVTVDGSARSVDGARGMQAHLWGTRRPEELRWLYCPLFEQGPAGRLEVASARLSRRIVGGLPGPWVSPVSWRAGDGTTTFTRLGALLRSPSPGVLHLRARTRRRALRGRAWCAPGTLAGYVYREPDGRELHVAQSDVASCELDLFRRAAPVGTWHHAGRWTSRHTTALEFHAPEPLPGVHYIPWDGER